MYSFQEIEKVDPQIASAIEDEIKDRIPIWN